MYYTQNTKEKSFQSVINNNIDNTNEMFRVNIHIETYRTNSNSSNNALNR